MTRTLALLLAANVFITAQTSPTAPPATPPPPPSSPASSTEPAQPSGSSVNREPGAAPAEAPAANAAAQAKSTAPKSPARTSANASPAKASAAKPPLKPATGPVSLAVSTQKKILVVRLGGADVKTYQVAVGTKAKPTPMGRFGINHIVWNPAWHPPAEKWAKGKKPAAPNDPKNPMKVVKIFFQEPDYYIHGTDREDSLGSAASHGCVRMAQSDVYELARFIMEHAGATRNDSWYQQVMNSDSPAEVRLPRAIPIAIGK